MRTDDGHICIEEGCIRRVAEPRITCRCPKHLAEHQAECEAERPDPGPATETRGPSPGDWKCQCGYEAIALVATCPKCGEPRYRGTDRGLARRVDIWLHWYEVELEKENPSFKFLLDGIALILEKLK